MSIELIRSLINVHLRSNVLVRQASPGMSRKGISVEEVVYWSSETSVSRSVTFWMASDAKSS